jgi:hypothetical protein
MSRLLGGAVSASTTELHEQPRAVQDEGAGASGAGTWCRRQDSLKTIQRDTEDSVLIFALLCSPLSSLHFPLLTFPSRPPSLPLTVYGLCAGAAVIRRRNETDTSSKVDTVYLALAVLYFTAAAIEIFVSSDAALRRSLRPWANPSLLCRTLQGIGAAYKQSIKLVKYYFVGSASVAVIVTAAELMRVIVHFTDKVSSLALCSFRALLTLSFRFTVRHPSCLHRWRASRSIRKLHHIDRCVSSTALSDDLL